MRYLNPDDANSMDTKNQEKWVRIYMISQAVCGTLFSLFLAWMLFYLEMESVSRIGLGLLLILMLFLNWRQWKKVRSVPPAKAHPEFFPELMTPSQKEKLDNYALLFAMIWPLMSLAIGWEIYDFEHGLKESIHLPTLIGWLYYYGGFWAATLSPALLLIPAFLVYHKHKRQKNV